MGNAGTLTVKAGEIEIVGGSELTANFLALAVCLLRRISDETGKGGNIDIEADYLFVADGAQVSTTTFGEGDAGNLNVRASEVELIAGSADFGSSGLFASSEDLGNGGNITVESDYLLVGDGAQIATSAFFDGDAGNLTIDSSEIELIGTSPGGTSSGLFSNVEEGATGSGGNILLTSEQLLLAEGSEISASTLDLGNGGNISIATEQLLINDGSQIAVSTSGSGNGGILNIEASNVELIGLDDLSSSGLFSNAIIGSGNGGNINLTSDRLSITDGATISASNFASRNADIPPGMGAAGNIDIDVDSLELDSTNPEDFSSITASTNSQAGGSITLDIGSGVLNNSSRIASETRGEGDGGSIDISATEFNLNNQGRVSVNSTGLGQAGDIMVASDSLKPR